MSNNIEENKNKIINQYFIDISSDLEVSNLANKLRTDYHFSHFAITIGNFDGIHLGHQNLIKTCLQHKNDQEQFMPENKLGTILFTFDPHPSHFFQSNSLSQRSVNDTLIDTTIQPHTTLHEYQNFVKIQSINQNIAKIAKLGIDIIIILRFNAALSRMSAEEFITRLRQIAPISHIVVGDDFHFGQGRKGNIQLLDQLQNIYQFKLCVISKTIQNNTIVSSTEIKNKLKIGVISTVNQLLDDYYTLSGTVIKGRQIAGSVIGLPTANIDLSAQHYVASNNYHTTKQYPDNKHNSHTYSYTHHYEAIKQQNNNPISLLSLPSSLLSQHYFADHFLLSPCFGVYFGIVTIQPNAKRLPMICNIGMRPTINHNSEFNNSYHQPQKAQNLGNEPCSEAIKAHTTSNIMLETHIIGYHGNLYGMQLRCQLLEFLRYERKFANIEQLKWQIMRDLKNALYLTNFHLDLFQ